MARMGLAYNAKRNGETFNEEETSLDEILGNLNILKFCEIFNVFLSGFVFALFGFGCQLMSGFTLPFPINILLLPLSITEWWIRFILADSALFVEGQQA